MRDSCALVGCYTTPDRGGRGRGLELFRTDPEGVWRHLLTTELVNPSYLLFNATTDRLYVAHGASDIISVLNLGGEAPAMLNSQVGGLNPVHLEFSPSGRHLTVAYYSSGEVRTFPIDGDGLIGPPNQILLLPGRSGPNAQQQTGSHPHQVSYALGANWALVADKGLDRVFLCRLDEDLGTLSVEAYAQLAPGAGPRHLVRHPTLPLIYVNNELDGTVSVIRHDLGAGRLEVTSSVPTLPSDFDGKNLTGEIILTATGKTLFVSNRGHESIVRFDVDVRTGDLSGPTWRPSGGRFPRFMALGPDSDCLYVANQYDDRIVRFGLDTSERLGEPTPVAVTGSPACILFIDREA